MVRLRFFDESTGRAYNGHNSVTRHGESDLKFNAIRLKHLRIVKGTAATFVTARNPPKYESGASITNRERGIVGTTVAPAASHMAVCLDTAPETGHSWHTFPAQPPDRQKIHMTVGCSVKRGNQHPPKRYYPKIFGDNIKGLARAGTF